MSLTKRWLEQCIRAYRNNIHYDRTYLDQQVNGLFGTLLNFAEEDWAHFYGSFVSNQTICLTQSLKCNVADGEGWISQDALIIYFRVLLEVYIRAEKWDFDFKSKVYGLLKNLYQTIWLIQNRDETTTQKHHQKLNQKIDALSIGEILCYHGGYQGHAIYLNIVKEKNGYSVFINNLGDGYTKYHSFDDIPGTNERQLVYQRSIFFSNRNRTQLEDYLLGVIKARKSDSENRRDHAFGKIYTTKLGVCDKRYDRKYGLTEISQITGNCAVKNYLLATRQILNDEEFYQSLFKRSIETTLSNYRSFDNEHLMPSKPDVCSSLMFSQIGYAAQTCQKLTDDIILYGNSKPKLDLAMEESTVQSESSYNMEGGLLGALFGLGLSLLATKLTLKDQAKPEHYLKAALGGIAMGGVSGGLVGHSIQKGIQTTTPKPQYIPPSLNNSFPLPEQTNHCYSCSNRI